MKLPVNPYLVHFIVFATALMASFALYGNSLGGGFVYDDSAFVDVKELKAPGGVWLTLTNPYLIAQTTGHRGLRPFTSFTFALNFWLFGESPFSFHVVNVALNGLAAFLVFTLINRLCHNQLLALFTAILWLFLPIHTEAVAYIKARDEILLAVFALLAWLAFLKGTEGQRIGWGWLAASTIMFLLALFSKEFAIVLPLLFLVVYYLQSRPPLATLAVVALPFLPVYAVYWSLAHDLILQTAAGEGNFFILNPLLGSSYLVRFWTAFKITFVYLAKTVVPYNLSATYDYNHLTLVENPLTSLQTLLGLALLGALFGFVVYRRALPMPFSIGAVIFLISYAVYSKFLFVGGQIMAERWVYFASLGICLIAAAVIEKIYRHKKIIAGAILGIVLAGYSIVVVARNPAWASEQTVYETMVQTAPNSIQGHKGLAFAYLRAGDYGRALPHIEECMRIYIGYPSIMPMLEVLAAYYSETGAVGRNVVVRGTGEVNSQLLALARAADSKNQESLKVLHSLAATAPDSHNHPIVGFAYALNYYKLGDRQALEPYLPWVPGTTREEKLHNLDSF